LKAKGKEEIKERKNKKRAEKLSRLSFPKPSIGNLNALNTYGLLIETFRGDELGDDRNVQG